MCGTGRRVPVRPSGGQWEAAGHPVRGHAPVTCRKLMRPHSRGDGCRGGLGRTGPCQEVRKWLALFRAHHVRGGGGTASGTGLADLLRDTVSSEELYHEAMSCACVGRTQQPGRGGGLVQAGPRCSWCESGHFEKYSEAKQSDTLSLL